VRALTEREGLTDQLLDVVELADGQRHHRLRTSDPPEVPGLSEVVRNGAGARQIDESGRDVAELELRHEPKEMRAHDALGVAEPVSQLVQLRGQRDPLRGCVGGDDRHHATLERIGESGRVTRAAREVDRLATQGVAPTAGRLVAERSGEAREQPCAELDVLVGEPGEALFEERHESIVLCAARPDDTPAVSRSRLGELVLQRETSRDAGGLDERHSRRAHVSCPRFGVAPRKEKPATLPCVRGFREVQGLERGLVQTRSLLEGEKCERAIAGAPGDDEALVELAACHRMVCKLREVRPGLVAVEAFERLGGEPVQPHAPGARETLVHRVADEHVREAESTCAARHI